LKKVASLAHAALANSIKDWLVYYPEKLLTVEEFIFLILFDQIHINRLNFNEREVLQGRYSSTYHKLKDDDKIQLFDSTFQSQYINERVMEIKKNQKFHDPNNIFENDLNSIIYCDQHDIPISFFHDDMYNLDTNTNRNGLNFFSNFSRSFIFYSEFIKETGLIDLQKRQDVYLSFGYFLDLPAIKTNNTSEINQRKQELEPVYEMMGDEFKSRTSFSDFVLVELIHNNYVGCSPSEFFIYVKNLDFNAIQKKYLDLQRAIDSREELTLYENANKQKSSSLIGNWHVSSTRLGVFKHRVLNETPPLHGRHNQEIKCNRRINNEHWLFTELFFGTTLNSVLAGSTF